MAHMPRRSAVLALSGTAATAHRAIQSEARLNVLRILLRDGSASRANLTTETGMSTSTVLTAIRELTSDGYVLTDVEGDLAGRRVTYSINRQKVTADLFDLMSWILGGSRTGDSST